MAHILQTLTDVDERATIVSIDGIGAYDLISRNATLQGLLTMEDGDRVLPFVRWLPWVPIHRHVGRRDGGVPRHTARGGRGAGRPLDAHVVCTWTALVIQERLLEGERVFAFLDDIYVVCMPERVADVYAIIQQELFAHARISVHHRKTQVWNRGGIVPQDIDIITAAARVRVPDAVVWRGAQELPAARQGLKVLGAPTGHPQYVQEFLRRKSEEQVLFERIPLVNDPQVGWLLLWMCASTRANFWLRMVSPELTLPFAVSRDRNVWQCLQTILDVRGAPVEAQQLASLPLTLGGLGLASAERTRHAAHWASWADCLAMVQQRHPTVSEEMVVGLDRDTAPCLAAVRQCREVLAEADFHPPGWRDLAVVDPERAEEEEPNHPKFGWQQFASRSLETKFLNERVWPRMTDAERALLRSQRGPLASAAVTALPTTRGRSTLPHSAAPTAQAPLALSSRTCRCDRQLDSLGHHLL